MNCTGRSLLALLLVGAGLVGCTGKSAAPVELVVFAASSLREPLVELGRTFEEAHPDTRVLLNFAGTQELRAQLEHGGRADLFFAADERHLEQLLQNQEVEAPANVVCNRLALVVAVDTPRPPNTFEQLPLARRIVLGTPEVPVGHYAETVLASATRVHGEAFGNQVRAQVVSRELNARQVLSKVTMGVADAAIVYESDARVAGDRVRVVPIPPEFQVTARYPLARVKGSRNPERAQAFVEHLQGPEAQRIFTAAGFSRCPEDAR